MGGRESLRSGAVLSALITLCVLLFAGFTYRQQQEAELEHDAAKTLSQELRLIARSSDIALLRSMPDFPDIPYGRMCRLIVEYKRAQAPREMEMLSQFRAEHERWEDASASDMTPRWREARKQSANAIREMAKEDGQAFVGLRDELEEYAEHDEETKELVDLLAPARRMNSSLLTALNALKDLCDVWKERADAPASGDEAWAKKISELREKEGDLVQKVSTEMAIAAAAE